jgi:hypothetical protein
MKDSFGRSGSGSGGGGGSVDGTKCPDTVTKSKEGVKGCATNEQKMEGAERREQEADRDRSREQRAESVLGAGVHGDGLSCVIIKHIFDKET